MQKMSLDALAREHLERARQHGSGRSAETIYGGHEHILRQTVVALTAGTTLADHENPGEAHPARAHRQGAAGCRSRFLGRPRR
jgi:hypothetical protein